MDNPAPDKDQLAALPADTEQLSFASFFADGEEEVYPHLAPEEVEETFLAAYAELPTQPLPAVPQQQAADGRVLLCLLLFLFSFVGGAVIGIITYPTVTIEIVSLTKSE